MNIIREAKRVGVITFCLLFFTGCFGSKEDKKHISRVMVKKYAGSRYQLFVNKKPYIVQGVCYNPIPICKDYYYDFFTDPKKPWLEDGKLMKELGINTIRIYNPSANSEAVKQVIADLYNNFGIRTIIGHWLGFWEYSGPCYGNSDFCQKIKKEVLAMVNIYKDEPGILGWVLGNENNYTFDGRINSWSTSEIDKLECPIKQKEARAKIYYSFVNSLAKEIKAIDKNHPIILGKGELNSLEIANTVCPDIDIVGCIIYRGKTFGNIFKSLKAKFDRPLLFIEFGADSYDAYLGKEDQNMQALFIENQWKEIYKNLFIYKKGEGNCLGGTLFEWTDELWKHNEYYVQGWSEHDTESNWSNGSYYFDIKAKNNKNMNEEWFGIVALSPVVDSASSLDKRVPRKAYYILREFFKNPIAKINETKTNVKKNSRK